MLYNEDNGTSEKQGYKTIKISKISVLEKPGKDFYSFILVQNCISENERKKSFIFNLAKKIK